MVWGCFKCTIFIVHFISIIISVFFKSYCVIILFYYISSTSDHGVALVVKKRIRNTVLGYNLKNDRMTSVHFLGKPFNITVMQVYAPTSNVEEAEVEWFYEDLQDLLELTPKKVSFSL